MSPATPVAIFLHDFRGGGAERVMVQLANGIADRGVATDMVVVNGEGPCRALLDTGVRLVDLGRRRTVAAVPALAAYLRRTRPAALVSALPHVNVAAVAARHLSLTGIPLLLTEHSQFSQARRTAGSALARVAHGLVPLAYRSAAGIVAVSRGVADEIARHAGLDPGRVQVIPNPVVSDALERQARAPLEHPWFAPGAPPAVVACGRLAWPKDLATLLEAVALAPRPFNLVVLGDGPDRPALQAMATRLGLAGRVEFAGFVGNPFRHMARAAVVALSSRSEGLPTVLVEAMACGTPVVATDCSPGPRELLEGGRLGRLVPPGDAPALAEALIAAVDHPPDLAAAREKAWRYSVDGAAAAYLGAIGRLAGHGRPTGRPAEEPFPEEP